MKYTERKQTPLKWHRFVQIVLLPVLIIASAFELYRLVGELCGLNLPLVSGQINVILTMLGYSVNNLGVYFWPVIGLVAAVLLHLVLCLYAWFGFFRWRNYARITWLSAVLEGTLFFGVLAYFSIIKYNGFIEIVTAWLRLKKGITLNNGLLIVNVVMVLIALLYLIFFVLNVRYYSKRKPLFDEFYEERDTAYVPSAPVSEAVIAEETPVTETVEAEPVEMTQPYEAVSEPEVISVPEVKTEEIIEETPAEEAVTEDVKEEIAEPVEENITEEAVEPAEEIPVEEKTEEADMIDVAAAEVSEKTVLPSGSEEGHGLAFCPNCGAKLSDADVNFCTNCGTKLH